VQMIKRLKGATATKLSTQPRGPKSNVVKGLI